MLGRFGAAGLNLGRWAEKQQENRQVCRLPRAKLKHVLWLASKFHLKISWQYPFLTRHLMGYVTPLGHFAHQKLRISEV